MAKALTIKTLENLKPGPARREVPDGLVRGLYFVLQPSGKAGWAVRYRAQGRPRKLTLGTHPALDLKAARELASKALVAVASGTDPAAEKQAAKAPKPADDRDFIEKVVPIFLERYAKPNTRPRTYAETRRVLNKEIVARWKGRRLSEIGKADIHELLDEIVDKPAPILANRTLALFSKMCSWAVERGIISASPCAGVKAPAPAQSRDRVLSDDELATLWKACDIIGWPFGAVTKLLMLTGARRSEVAEMRWAELDIEARTWTLPASRAKNGVEHTVPLSDPVIEILSSLPHIGKPGGFVFTTVGNRPVAGFARVKERFDRALPADMAGWTFHDLRRTFASGCARLGIAVHVVESSLNHRSGTIRGVAAIYNRYSYDVEKRAAMDAWARHVAVIVSGKPAGNVLQIKRG